MDLLLSGVGVGEEKETRDGFDVADVVLVAYVTSYLLVLFICILRVNCSRSFIALTSIYISWVNCDISLVCMIHDWWIIRIRNV